MKVHEVDRDTQRAIAVEFHNMLRAAETVVVDGREFARDVIHSAFGDEAGDTMIQYITGAKQEPLSFLIDEVPANIMESFITSEHPQTTAFLLSKMTPETAAGFLNKMPEDRQTDVLLRIANLANVKVEVVEEVRDVLRTQLRGLSSGDDEEAGGPESVADILNFIDRNNEERILAEIEEMYPELAETIRGHMFTFEDIKAIDDRGIQTVMKEIPRETLLLALKTASAELRDLLFRNMSQRAAEMLKDDLDSLGPQKLKDVEKAQQGIIDIVRRLESEGKISVGGVGGDVLV